MYRGGEVGLVVGETIFVHQKAQCYWTYGDLEVMTGKLYSLVVIQVQVQVALSL